MIVFLVLFAADILVGFLRRVSTRYTITTQRLRIERGLLSKHVQQTRIERVQNVNTNQTFVSRVLRVGTVDFDTAGTDDADFAFAGVAQPEKVSRKVEQALHEASQAQAQSQQQQGLAAAPPSPPPPPASAT